MSILDEIKQKAGCEFRPAGDAAIQRFRALGAPQDALKFFQDSEPMRCAEIEKARLWPISELVVENTDAVPGYYAHPCGYVVFATTIYGDAFCFDTNSLGFPASASVVLIAHDLEPENDQMKRQDLEKLAKPVAVNFEDFLQKFVAGTLDLKPLYPPMDDSTSNPRT